MRLLRGCEMPLPNAPDVETSRIYQQFKGLNALGNTTNGVTADLMDNIRLQQFIDFNSEDELRRLLLVSMASQTMSTSGPMAGTAQFVQATVTDTDFVTLFQPGLGEVWQLLGIGAVVSGGSGTRTFAAYLFDGSTRLNWLSSSSSGSNLTFTGEGEYPDAPFFFDNQLYCQVQSTGTFDSILYNLAVIRVR